MARFPDAQWRPIPVNYTQNGMGAIYGIVLHIMEGTLDGSDNWFRNPTAQASSHFGVGKDGRIYQWVDTRDKAWAEASGNPNYISIENEGYHGDALTAPQLLSVAKIVAWASRAHGVPFQIADHPGQTGLGYHGMGGSAWGGHIACPSDPIVNQRYEILTKAGGIVSGPLSSSLVLPKGAHVYSPPLKLTVKADLPCQSGGAWLLISDDGGIANMAGSIMRGNTVGKSYFAGHVADHLDYPTTADEKAQATRAGWAIGDCYVIVSTKNERYGPIF